MAFWDMQQACRWQQCSLRRKQLGATPPIQRFDVCAMPAGVMALNCKYYPAVFTQVRLDNCQARPRRNFHVSSDTLCCGKNERRGPPATSNGGAGGRYEEAKVKRAPSSVVDSCCVLCPWCFQTERATIVARPSRNVHSASEPPRSPRTISRAIMFTPARAVGPPGAGQGICPLKQTAARPAPQLIQLSPLQQNSPPHQARHVARAGAASYQHEWEVYVEEARFDAVHVQRTLQIMQNISKTFKQEWELYLAEARAQAMAAERRQAAVAAAAATAETDTPTIVGGLFDDGMRPGEGLERGWRWVLRHWHSV